MKFSTEAIVAAAVAVVFLLLSLGAIAREHGERPISVSNAYVAASNADLTNVAAGDNDVFGFY
jgi:hypothetical protein